MRFAESPPGSSPAVPGLAFLALLMPVLALTPVAESVAQGKRTTTAAIGPPSAPSGPIDRHRARNSASEPDPSLLTPTRFFTVTPCRVADTRNPASPSGGPALAAKAARIFPVVGICGIPSTATAVAVNVTVVDETDYGNLRIYPAGSALPGSSTVNFAAGKTRANNAVIPLGSAGQIAVQCDMPPGSTGQTHLLFDVTGYFAAGQVNPVITTSDTGTMLVLQTQMPAEIVRVGLLKSWGAAITEVSLNGTDYVNNDDPGRQIQTSLWDANPAMPRRGDTTRHLGPGCGARVRHVHPGGAGDGQPCGDLRASKPTIGPESLPCGGLP
jgi:hypothetical protein